MRNLVASKLVIKDLDRFAKARKGIQVERLFEAVSFLLFDKPIPERFRDHPLSGDMKGFRALSIADDMRLVYKTDQQNVYIVRVGTHSSVYK